MIACSSMTGQARYRGNSPGSRNVYLWSELASVVEGSASYSRMEEFRVICPGASIQEAITCDRCLRVILKIGGDIYAHIHRTVSVVAAESSQ